MLITDAVRETGIAVRTEPQGPEMMVFHMMSRWLFICEGPLLDIAFKIDRFPPGDDWKPKDLNDGLVIGLLEQVDRPIEAAGKLSEILVEGQPCILTMPGQKTVVRYDGKKLRARVPLDNVLFFNSQWSRHHARDPIKVTGVTLGTVDPNDPAAGDRVAQADEIHWVGDGGAREI